MSDAVRSTIFVDRDGTIIREREYLSDPEGVELLPGAVEGLSALHEAGRSLVIVTNQSGIARGLYGEQEYQAVQRRVLQVLEASGVHILASYHCPHHPRYTGPCECRKPGLELFRRAAVEHGLDLARAVFIGDRLRDVLPARALGGQGVLVRTGYGAAEAPEAPDDVWVVADLEEAAGRILDAGDCVDRSDDPS